MTPTLCKLSIHLFQSIVLRVYGDKWNELKADFTSFPPPFILSLLTSLSSCLWILSYNSSHSSCSFHVLPSPSPLVRFQQSCETVNIIAQGGRVSECCAAKNTNTIPSPFLLMTLRLVPNVARLHFSLNDFSVLKTRADRKSWLISTG